MDTFQELYDVTAELHEHLSKPLPKEERESYIGRVEKLLSRREHLIRSYEGEKVDAEAKKAEQIVLWNKEINQRLQTYLNTIKIDMNKLKQQKQTVHKYENPYDAQPDGFFIDKKN